VPPLPRGALFTLVCLWTRTALAQPPLPPPDELARLREENQRLRAELERKQAPPDPPGLIQWRIQGLMDVTGVASRNIHSDVRLARGAGLTVLKAFSYRAWERAAVELTLINTGTEAWWVDRALLVGAGGHALEVLSVWMKDPIRPGQLGRVLVEVRGEPPPGTYTLRLWHEAEAPDLLLENVRFPEAVPHPGGRP
jgi:uncharacterized protein (TIGR02268 family)